MRQHTTNKTVCTQQSMQCYASERADVHVQIEHTKPEEKQAKTKLAAVWKDAKQALI
jgi:hypothetical protein